MEFIPRSDWNARTPNGGRNVLAASPLGAVLHWEGTPNGAHDHSTCVANVQAIQNYHMDTKGWADIAYNFLVCQHGYVFEGRGLGIGSAANGTTIANLNYYAVCAIVGPGDPNPEPMLSGIGDAIGYVRAHGAGTVLLGHRDVFTTDCPGDGLYALIKSGRWDALPVAVVPYIVGANGYVPPVPLIAPAFPLPTGWYFGPESGPVYSVSGYHGRSFDLKTWQQRMKGRGWTISVDGHYGPQTANVAAQFQQQKGLFRDGLIGVQTWDTAWTAPVTRG